MLTSSRETLLCRYLYDSLDQTIAWTQDKQASLQRFYCKNRLATEIQAAAKYCFLKHDDHVLAQQLQIGTTADTTLLATDQQRSVLNAIDATLPNPLAYSPYGHRPQGNGLLSRLGFNGERPDPVTGHYHLGNGYRQFNPVLMRFNSPDSWSPFGRGGLNAYAYCDGDSVNRTDPTGHVFRLQNLIDQLVVNNSTKPLSDDVRDLLRWTEFRLGGSPIIEAEATSKLKNAEDYFIDRATASAKESILQDMNSFEGKAYKLTTREQVNNVHLATMTLVQKKQDALSNLELVGKQYLVSTESFHSNRLQRKIDKFKRKAENIVQRRYASIPEDVFSGATPEPGASSMPANQLDYDHSAKSKMPNIRQQ